MTTVSGAPRSNFEFVCALTGLFLDVPRRTRFGSHSQLSGYAIESFGCDWHRECVRSHELVFRIVHVRLADPFAPAIIMRVE